MKMTLLAFGSKSGFFGESALTSEGDAYPSARSRCHKPIVPNPPANPCKKRRRLLMSCVTSDFISSPSDELIQIQQDTADADPNRRLSALDSLDALSRKQATPKVSILFQNLLLL